jgi:sulfate adenylyltransferase
VTPESRPDRAAAVVVGGPDARVAELTRTSASLPRWTLTAAARADLELLLTGAYAPVTRFHGPDEAAAIRRTGRLPDGTPFPRPVSLEVEATVARAAARAGGLALEDADGTLLAVLRPATVTDAEAVLADAGRADATHEPRRVVVGGSVDHVRLPARWDFPDLRGQVATIRAEVGDTGQPVLAVSQRAPADRRTVARWARAAASLDARLLVVVPDGGTDGRRATAEHRAWRRLRAHLPADSRVWLAPSGDGPADPAATSLLPVIARNAGATHLLVAASAAADDGPAGLGLTPVHAGGAAAEDPAPGSYHPDVAAELERGDPPRSQGGFVVLLSGLSGSGKSTVAQVLRARLAESARREVTLLDGDLVRRHLSSELGFSREHRDLNVRRIGYVASEIARHGGIAICAPIAPYDRTRREVRQLIEQAGGSLVLVHVATPLEVCERRDVKGLYARARAGLLTGFTGIDDPYEVPADAEVTVDTTSIAPEAAAQQVLARLAADGWIDAP